MSDFRSRLNSSKGTSLPLTRRQELDRDADAVAEFLRDYIVRFVAPYSPKNVPLQAEMCLTQRLNGLALVETPLPANSLSDRYLKKKLWQVALHEDSVYFRNRLAAVLKQDGFTVGKWQFMKLDDRSTDDYGQNFASAPGGWCMYPEGRYSPASPLDPEKPFTHEYVYSFGHKHTYIQGSVRADVPTGGYVGFVVRFRE